MTSGKKGRTNSHHCPKKYKGGCISQDHGAAGGGVWCETHEKALQEAQ